MKHAEVLVNEAVESSDELIPFCHNDDVLLVNQKVADLKQNLRKLRHKTREKGDALKNAQRLGIQFESICIQVDTWLIEIETFLKEPAQEDDGHQKLKVRKM